MKNKLFYIIIAASLLFGWKVAAEGKWFTVERADTVEGVRTWSDHALRRVHDDEMHVTCWIFVSNARSPAMTCLPDSSVRR